MHNVAIWRTDTPKNVSLRPTNDHGWLTDGDSNMMPLWFDGDCMPNLSIDKDDLPDSEEFDNDYERTLH